MKRYQTQIALPEIGIKGQYSLNAAHVLIVGAGGLGAIILPALAGAGVGHIHIIDDDVVEEKNLHRQTFYRMKDIGTLKVTAASQHLKDLNPYIKVTAYPVAAQKENILEILKGYDEKNSSQKTMIVVDAADNFATTYILNDICFKKNIFLVTASVSRWHGYVGAFCRHVPSYRAVFPIMSHYSGDCSTVGVIGTVVGLIAMLQAQLVLSLLLDIAPSPAGILHSWNGQSMRMSSFSFKDAVEPENQWPFLSVKELKESDILIDVRDDDEVPLIKHASFYHCPVKDLHDKNFNFSKLQRLVFCCQSGIRAVKAAEIFLERGYDNFAFIALNHQQNI